MMVFHARRGVNHIFGIFVFGGLSHQPRFIMLVVHGPPEAWIADLGGAIPLLQSTFRVKSGFTLRTTLASFVTNARFPGITLLY